MSYYPESDGHIRYKRYTNADLKISIYVLIFIKKYPENFAFLFLRILELFARKVCLFLKK